MDILEPKILVVAVEVRSCPPGNARLGGNGGSGMVIITYPTKKMKFDLTMEDYTIILNALHYYKKVEKGNFQQYDVVDRINGLRDKLAYQQIIPSEDSNRGI